jgi:hypothetical protein
MRGKILFGAAALSLVFAGSAFGQDFQCYKAKDTAKAFVKTSATVADLYAGSTVTDFKKPFLLCDPASIAGSPIADPAARLSCFKVKGAKLAAATAHSVTDDFGTRSESIQKVFVVCDAATATP